MRLFDQQSRSRRRRFTLLIAWVTAISSGCATLPAPPSPEARAELGRIGVIALPSVPQGEFHTYAKGRIEGGARGAAEGAVVGMFHTFAAAGSGGGPYAGAAAAIAGLIFTLTGAGVGGVLGAREAVPAGTAREIERQINAVLADMDLGAGLAETLVEQSAHRSDLPSADLRYLGRDEGSGPSQAARTGETVDTIIEIRVTEAGLLGGSGETPDVRFYMNAHVRLVHAADGVERYSRDFLHTSERRPYAQWFLDDAHRLGEAFQEALDRLSGRILDELLLVTHFPFASGLWAMPGSPEFGTCWFRPLDPAHTLRSFWGSIGKGSEQMITDAILYTPVHSLQPMLEWEPFPRPRDRRPENASLLGRISEVSYDLKVWEVSAGYPQRLVIDRAGLAWQQYRPDVPLQPDTRYFWTFRARYRLDGMPHVTRWAFSSVPATAEGMPPGGSCDLDDIPVTNYFRFVTP